LLLAGADQDNKNERKFMMKIQMLLPSFILLIIPIATAASTPKTDYQAMYSKCLKDAGRTNNASVTSCSNSTSDAAKLEIASLSKKIYAMLSRRDKEDAQQLQASQKAWENYRDTHCKLAGKYVGLPMYSYCPMQLNIARVNELRELAGE
jgi:uncharacterized protein YecT (DUF1311 family)